jgi:hypothetical protein
MITEMTSTVAFGSTACSEIDGRRRLGDRSQSEE